MSAVRSILDTDTCSKINFNDMSAVRSILITDMSAVRSILII